VEATNGPAIQSLTWATTAETPPAEKIFQQNGIRICIDYTQIRVR
jgi:hypothetical protein